MLKSTLTPEAISKPTKAKLNSFGGFMTGRNGVNLSSANNIVNFNRVGVGVSPLTPDINSIISNISTNILNSVDKSVRSITQFNADNTKLELTALKNDIYSKISQLTSEYETLKSQVDLASLKADDTIQVVKEQSPEQFKLKAQKIINDIQTKVDKSDIQIQNKIQIIQNDINSLVETQSAAPQQVDPKSSATSIQNIAVGIKDEVGGILQNTLRNFSSDYNKRVKTFDDVRPNNILTKFTSLYQNAIGFITYFGNDKNIKVVQDNLKFLRKMFEESFEVAKVLRQTIVKIVKQLSNLPSATPNSGGLNLNVAVPRGNLKPPAGNVGLGSKIGVGLGIGALGLGGLAAAASGMQSAKQFQEEKLAESSVSPVSVDGNIPENIVDNFSSIVERFTSAVNSLIDGVKQSSGAGGGEGAGSSPTPKSSPSSPSSIGAGSGLGGSGQDFATLATIAALESGSAQGQADVAQSVYNRLGDTGQMYGKSITEILTRRGQYQVAFIDPNSSRGSGTEIAEVFKNILGEDEAAKAIMYYYSRKGRSVSEKEAREIYKGASRAISDPKLRENATRHVGGRTEFKGYDAGLPNQVHRGSRNDNYFAVQYGSRTQMARGAQAAPSGLFNPPSETSTVAAPQQTATATSQATPRPTQSTIAPAPVRAQQVQARAQAVSAPAQQTPTTISLPPTVIDAAPTAPEQSQGGSLPPPPPPSGGTIEVPFLPTTNPDNFLTMYSRIVYNIVDG